MEILLRLGYSSKQITHQLLAIANLTGERLTRANTLIAKLDQIDAAIEEAEDSAMLVKSCEGEFDFSAQVNLLRRRGQRTLLELGRLLDLPVQCSPYVSSVYRIPTTLKYQ